MIFVTVGTLHYPFERLMRAVEVLPAEELVVQHGPANPPPGVTRATPFMAFDDLTDAIDAADTVVTHAGCGTMAIACRAGHTPIVLPRLKRFGEHVDDHQLELAAALADEGKAIAVSDVESLGEAVRSAPPRRPAEAPVGGRLHVAVREALIGGGPAGPERSAPRG